MLLPQEIPGALIGPFKSRIQELLRDRGVGNHRNGLTEENLNVKVIGIGVPTVVDAATIVHDSMAHLLETLDEAEQKEFLEEMISPHLHGMFVTPKDVDETIKYLSFTISDFRDLKFDF